MKRDAIKVGAKSKSKRAQLALEYRRPESVADCLEICHKNEAAVSALFNRGYTIWLQDRFGRPMFEAGDEAPKIQAAFDAAIPGTTKGISLKRQVQVAIPKGQKSFSPEEVAMMMAKAGITVVSQ
jgi:hypothetical protein